MITATTMSMKNPIGLRVMMFMMCVVSQVVNGEQPMRCLPKEREALLQFKAAIVDPYGMLSSWTSPHCCQWEGIRCSNLTSHISILDLHGEYPYDSGPYLSGEIHKSLMELPQLQYLNLSSNYFQDTHIPEFLVSLRNLKYLDLSHCDFGGRIPSQLGSLSHLKYLNLALNYLEGSIPHQLGNLSQLQHLDLRGNLLEGNIAPQLGNLSQLHELYLGGYYRYLNISDGGQWLSNLISLAHLSLDSVSNLNTSHTWLQVIAKLPKLRELSLVDCSLSDHFILSSKHSKFNFSTSLSVLDLSGNTFTSPMVFRWVSNITSNLVHLDLSDNNLIEDLPSILGNLSSGCVRHSLQELDLRGNYIIGTFPDISVFSSLKTLLLNGNKLSGIIPECVKLPSPLESLSVRSNSLQGGIPKSFGNACSLLSLDISSNGLSDDLPMIISHLSGCARYSLQVLRLNMNQISGTLPDFSTFISLKILYLGNNQLNGEIPMDIQFPPKLEELYISSNSLKGLLTDYHFSNMSKLEYLDLSDNSLGLAFTQNWIPPFQLLFIHLRSCQLGPTFPMWLQTQNKFVTIDISNATISGIIPEWFWAKLPLQKVFYPLFLRNYAILDLSKNKFSNTLSFLCGDDAISIQTHLDISYNQLSGNIPDCWKQINSLVYLDLSHNNFSGKIPTSMGWLLDLEALLLRNNNLVEGIPFSIKNCTWLIMLDLSENKLSGSIPDWIGTKEVLKILSLGKNQFFGSLPITVCCLRSIQVLDLSLNNLSGKIPKCINNLISMAAETEYYSVSHSYDLEAWLTWKGSKQIFMDESLELLKNIDLSSNHFSEEIPVEIEKLSGLISLNLSRNNLIGKIPSSIGNLTSLETLDLSRNQLVGSIPSSLAQIYFLSVLDLSYNHLSGEIPTSTQLQSFNTSSYEDNLGLCGPPLEKFSG
ncbi:receptor-like protein 12 [Vigna radiata var. radiata]|uniref:Receptor-like protein 12 n=1 Tax=Vigna radiata var. radiata TaxID=3916 RepID=A0A3Q0EXM4_VIGRR|nr:receptor-like protein 12 [Vigna radiata var. radiata]